MTDNAGGAAPARRSPSGLARHTIIFPGGRRALAVVAPAEVSGAAVAGALQLEPPRGLIVLGGSTTELPPGVAAALSGSLGDGLARLAAAARLTVITGGTDAGIFALFGRALAKERTTTCVGVAPVGAVTWPGRGEDESVRLPLNELVQLEPHHTHFLLVEGTEWGTETGALIELAATLAARCPSVAILAGGGEGARQEVLEQVRRGREVVVLAGTDRFADELARAATNDPADAIDPRTAEAAASGLVTVLDLAEPQASLAERVRERLGLTEGEAAL